MQFRPAQMKASAEFLGYLKHFPIELRSRVVNKSNAQTKSIQMRSAGEAYIRYVRLHANFIKCKQRRGETRRDGAR